MKKYISYTLIVLGLLLLTIKTNTNIEKIDIEFQMNNLKQNSKNISIKKAELIDYIAYLKIPKINLNKGIVSKNSKFNNVDRNIQTLKESDMPDIKNSNLILAAHSGNSNVSYFKDLNKLEINDNIYIEYNNKEYQYKIVNYYTVEKTGLIDIIRNKNKTTLTLITCIENTNKQLVIISELYKITNL